MNDEFYYLQSGPHRTSRTSGSPQSPSRSALRADRGIVGTLAAVSPGRVHRFRPTESMARDHGSFVRPSVLELAGALPAGSTARNSEATTHSGTLFKNIPHARHSPSLPKISDSSTHEDEPSERGQSFNLLTGARRVCFADLSDKSASAASPSASQRRIDKQQPMAGAGASPLAVRSSVGSSPLVLSPLSSRRCVPLHARLLTSLPRSSHNPLSAFPSQFHLTRSPSLPAQHATQE